MKTPVSPHFTPIPLTGMYNTQRETLDETLRLTVTSHEWYGGLSLRGIPFELGVKDQPNVILLDQQAVHIALEPFEAAHILFLHAVADRPSLVPPDLSDSPDALACTGSELGDLVSEYRLEYVDGSSETVEIRRRHAIQQAHIAWGNSPFNAVTAHGPRVMGSALESASTGKKGVPFGRGEVRIVPWWEVSPEHIWIYAFPNPHPEKAIRGITCSPRDERSIIYAITHSLLADHPLRPARRRKFRLDLPPGAALDAIFELEEIAVDLGTLISARAVLDYDRSAWLSQAVVVQPNRSESAVIVEAEVHPQSRLYVQTGPGEADVAVYELSKLESESNLIEVPPAFQTVRLRFVESGSNTQVPVRLHLHGSAGEYLPPKGHHRKVNDGWFEDYAGEFVNGGNQYCYIPGECVVDLPMGEVFVEATRGYEVTPIRTSFTVKPETKELTFILERALHWREKGWVTADTHVHFLSPQTALLEGAAEGVNVVNLLASQWGEMFSNVGDFDGRTTFGAQDFGGNGEFLVRVGSENRMNILGHISLLGYSGALIQPLCTAGPDESALGDALEVSMADWAQRCIDQNGLVVTPHMPNPQAERPADIILGLVHAVEMVTFTPFDSQISPYGLADWYRYLNLGYHIPVVGGSDKMGANILLGGIRTYAHLGQQAFTYESWMAAIKGGNTFVTVGPLVELNVEGLHPGQSLRLPLTGGTVTVSWQVESTSLPIERVEIVMGGLAVEQVEAHGQFTASGTAEVTVTQSTWIALRVRGSYKGRQGDVAAHSSAVQVFVGDQPLFSQPEARRVLEQIEGTMAYIDTLATKPDIQAFKRIRASMETAYNRLHQRLHQQGLYHQHTPNNK